MAQHDMIIDNQSAPSARSDLNDLFAALVSQNSGATEPLVTFANMVWVDTTDDLLKVRNEANSGWITVGAFDQTNGRYEFRGNVIQAITTAGLTFKGSGGGTILAVSNTGAVTTSGNIDGRSISTDGSKLDGIEAGASLNRADHTGTQPLSTISDAGTAAAQAMASQAVAEAGTDNNDVMTALRVKQAIDYVNAEILHVQNRVASGVAPAALTASTWNTHGLNSTQYNNITGASLASNQITLPAGTYVVEATAQGATVYNSNNKTNIFKSRLRNVTDTTTELTGAGARSSGYSGTLGDTHDLPLRGRFTLASSKVLELQVWGDAGGNAEMGTAVSSGEDEVYADIIIRKI